MRPPLRGYDVMLLTTALREQLPPLYEQDEKADDAIAYVKFFDPCRSWTWYATEFDGEDRFWGLVDGHEEKFGYFSLSELQSYKGALGIGIERDTSFRPTRLGDLRKRQRPRVG